MPEEIGSLESLTELTLPLDSDLSKLTHLSLSGCSLIKELPCSLGELEALVELHLSSSGIVNLPDSIGNLKKLRVIRIDYTKIKRLLDTIGLVEMLEELYVGGCLFLRGQIPDEVGRLSHLRTLHLSYTRICGLPMTISHVARLQTLELEGCLKLQHLPELPSSLIHLSCHASSFLSVPDPLKLVNLDYLDLYGPYNPPKEFLQPEDISKSIKQLPSDETSKNHLERDE
ncbi:uncharacterized protein LOC130134546 [Syzygium oleosum]|uniref:uncharacterized protein LOC130134546 n=1 Tax=Syzygium oleosum TaxID=219896 RepID=UPI0024B90F77|nr:uncharacterized protein LOC130134546 [Syzygium oleosum]